MANQTGMLVLSRRVDERIMIGDDIEIEVLGIDRGQVRLGFRAPKSIAIHREEIYERIQLEKRS